MVIHTAGVGIIDASARKLARRFVPAIATAVTLAGCASYHPAPIVHRAPVERTVPPPPAAAPPVATAPAAPAVPATPAIDAAPVIETTPIPSSRIESRPLPGPGGTIAPPPPAPTSGLLKTEPKATKRPYSDALLAEMRGASAARPGVAPGPVASAPPTAPPPPAPAPPAAAPSAPPAASPGPGSGFVWPAKGEVVQGFSEPSSMGISIAGKPGEPIIAAADGRVIFSGPGPRGYGNLVILKHANETLSVYGHNRTLLVKEGQNVKRGQRIAELGSSGTDSPKLRFEIRKDGKPVDPNRFLPPR